MAISFGADANTDLMHDVAEISSGAHFIVPGSKDVDDMRDDLIEIFAEIAGARPLRLVE